MDERVPRLAFRLQRFDEAGACAGGHVPGHGNDHGNAPTHAYRAGAVVRDRVRDVRVRIVGVERGALRRAGHGRLVVVWALCMVVVVRMVVVRMMVRVVRVRAARVGSGRGVRARGGGSGREGDRRVGTVHGGAHGAGCRG